MIDHCSKLSIHMQVKTKCKCSLMRLPPPATKLVLSEMSKIDLHV